MSYHSGREALLFLLVTSGCLAFVAAYAHDFVYVPVVSIPYMHSAPVPPITAIADIRTFGENGNGVKGRIVFVQSHTGGPVFIFGNVTGLEKGQHGFHIHQFGDTSDGCKSMGAHFNPHMVSHGGPVDLVRHVGDLGNLNAGDDGKATVSETDWAISLAPGVVNSIIGRGLVVHAGKDDLGRGGDAESLRTGNAGGRVACGTISLAAPHVPSHEPFASAPTTKPPKRR